MISQQSLASSLRHLQFESSSHTVVVVPPSSRPRSFKAIEHYYLAIAASSNDYSHWNPKLWKTYFSQSDLVLITKQSCTPASLQFFHFWWLLLKGLPVSLCVMSKFACCQPIGACFRAIMTSCFGFDLTLFSFLMLLSFHFMFIFVVRKLSGACEI